MARYVQLASSDLLLDVGCGSGRYARFLGLQPKPVHMVGIDIDVTGLNLAKAHIEVVASMHRG